ncbi:MAG: uracil-DNA glycosylase [Treponemataceae bacterium]
MTYMDAQTKSDLYNFFSTVDAFINETPLQQMDVLFTDDSIKPSMKTLEEVNSLITTCTECKLSCERNNPIFGEGVHNPLALVIGDAPNAEQDASSQIFVGEEGQLLDKMLASISLSSKLNCFITHGVKCTSPNNREPEADEFNACASFLHAQIRILQPKLILCVGAIALRYFFCCQKSLDEVHGQFFDCQGIPFMPTYNSRVLLTNDTYKRPAWEDLKLFRNRLLQINPSYQNEFGSHALT